MGDATFLDLLANYGLPTAAAAYFFWRYDKRTEGIIQGKDEIIAKQDKIIEASRAVIDKQVDQQSIMIQAQAKMIEDQRTGKVQ